MSLVNAISERPTGSPAVVGRRRRERVVAFSAAAALHAAAILAALDSATGAFSGGAGAPGGGGDAFTVALVKADGIAGLTAEASTSAQAAAPTPLEDLQRKVRADYPDRLPTANEQTARGGVAQLFDEIARSHRGNAKDPTGNDSSSGAPRPKGEAGAALALAGAAADQGEHGKAEGELWDQIETCWRPDSAVPVTLEVVLESGGRLAAPPRILRPANTRLDERRLASEARAIQAVAACAPFRTGAPLFGQRTYRFAFAPTRHVAR